MARDLFVTPLEEIKFEDIADLVNIAAEEGIRLEFKKDLPTSDGQPDRWMRDQFGIGRVARDDIAKEVVAFSNAYGGAVIIGIDETDAHPKRAKQLASPQIPRVVDCAEQIARALQSIIDPPLPMLEVRGIASSASGEGAILIRVGASPSAPHGFGTPLDHLRSPWFSVGAAFDARTAIDVLRTDRESAKTVFRRSSRTLGYSIRRLSLDPKVVSQKSQEKVDSRWPYTSSIFGARSCQNSPGDAQLLLDAGHHRVRQARLAEFREALADDALP